MVQYRYAPHVIAGTPQRTTPKVVITMPAYHAERTLERTVLAIPEGVADELILVDDASTDGTVTLARQLGLTVHVHPVNKGYGGNQKSCYRLALESGADIVVLLHPDYQYEPKAVPLLIAPILAGDADMTFGSRFAGMGDPLGSGMPVYRFLGNRVTTIAQNLALGTRFTDMHSGMRAYTRRCLESLPFLGFDDGFPFDAQFLVDAVSSGLRVVEVPIPTRYTEESSSIGIGRSLRYVFLGTAYAIRRGLERGRRGRRYLSSWKRSGQATLGDAAAIRTKDVPPDGPTHGAPTTTDDAASLRGALAHAATFNVSKRTALSVTSTTLHSPIDLPGWTVHRIHMEALAAGGDGASGLPSYGVLVLDGSGLRQKTEALVSRTRGLLDAGGLLALVELPIQRRPALLKPIAQIGEPALWRALRLAGYEVVEGHRTGRRTALLVARPFTEPERTR
jgi:hypothetical protein